MKLKKMLRGFLGILFLILGVLGLFLPILQGILFLGIGFLLLAPHVPLFQRALNHLKDRYPDTYEKIKKRNKL